MQLEGSKGARLGVLFSSSQDSDLSGLLLVKVFEITTASYRFVKSKLFWQHE
jgi:UDP-glucose:glycoprotein glucosyltransferase